MTNNVVHSKSRLAITVVAVSLGLGGMIGLIIPTAPAVLTVLVSLALLLVLPLGTSLVGCILCLPFVPFGTESIVRQAVLAGALGILTLAGVAKLMIAKGPSVSVPGTVRYKWLPVLAVVLSVNASVLPALAANVDLLVFLKQTLTFDFLMVAIPTYLAARNERGGTVMRLLMAITIAACVNSTIPIMRIARAYGSLHMVENLQEVRGVGCGVYSIAVPGITVALAAASPKTRLLYVFATGMLVLSTVLSMTRSYWIGLGVTVVSLCVLLPRDLRPRFRRAFERLFFVIVVSGTCMLIANTESFTRMISWIMVRAFSIAYYASDVSALDRIAEAHALLRGIAASPIWGHGMGAPYEFMSPSPFSWGQGPGLKQVTYSHNFYLYHMYAVGLVGLLCFVYFIWAFFNLGRRIIRTAPDHWTRAVATGITAGFAGLCVASLWTPQFADKTAMVIVGVLYGVLLAVSEPSGSHPEGRYLNPRAG